MATNAGRSWHSLPRAYVTQQPMPGADKLITFQGENGNLVQSPWVFKPRGQSGKMVSDLLPNVHRQGKDRRFANIVGLALGLLVMLGLAFMIGHNHVAVPSAAG